MVNYTTEYFKKQGAIGGKKHNGIKAHNTRLLKYGSDYYKQIVRKRKINPVKSS